MIFLSKSIMPTEIKSFSGHYSWLSNFYLVDVILDGNQYPSVEHAYQAAKTLDPNERDIIRKARTPNEAKKLGKYVTIRKDWSSIRVDVMRRLLQQKFSVPELKVRLLATGDAIITEGNYWNDTFWGVCNGKGKNVLGKLIMEIRDSIRNDAILFD